MTSNEILADDAWCRRTQKPRSIPSKKFGSAAHASRFQITVKKLRIQCCRLKRNPCNRMGADKIKNRFDQHASTHPGNSANCVRQNDHHKINQTNHLVFPFSCLYLLAIVTLFFYYTVKETNEASKAFLLFKEI